MEKKVHNNKRYGLVGKDIAYSFSRSYFAEKFQKEDISDCTYENFDLESIEDIQTILKSENLSGLNVTIPYKEAIIPYVDHDYLIEPEFVQHKPNGCENHTKKVKAFYPLHPLLLFHGISCKNNSKDDAHIFCMPNQLDEEFKRVIDLVLYVFSTTTFLRK